MESLHFSSTEEVVDEIVDSDSECLIENYVSDYYVSKYLFSFEL